MGAEAYPLTWPMSQGRSKFRLRSRFELAFDKARRHLTEQLRLLRAQATVISTNIPLRKSDGMPYADTREPMDPGVAVYFVRNGRHLCVACDKWDRVKDNLHAVGCTLEALRGVERWGSGHMVEQAFTGFLALPPAYRPWRTVFGYKPEDPVTLDLVEAKYKKLAFERHPDRISDETPMKELNDAITQARRELD